MGESKRKKMNRVPLTRQEMKWAEMANANLRLFEGRSDHSALMQSIFDAADVVWAIVRDGEAPTGLAFILVKGSETLQALANGKEAVPLRVTAVIANSHEEAEAYKWVFGDGEPKEANA